MQFHGSSRQYEISERSRRRDTRYLGEKVSAFLKTPFGTVAGALCCIFVAAIGIMMPFSGEVLLLTSWALGVFYFRVEKRAFDMPFRVPVHAQLRDGSSRLGKDLGKGICYLGNDIETREQIYVSNSDLRTHQIVFGTTGSGKTEYLMGQMCNALAQNSGFIMIDGKGDPKTDKDIFRIARTFGREDDFLVINFLSAGRDYVEKQKDKITNNVNLMGNTSSGMLIELLVTLMDDAGATGDMWKGRAISFVASLTRVLVYMRDKGYIILGSERFIEYFELNAVERLVYHHDGAYGDRFESILEPLKAYLASVSGYVNPQNRVSDKKTLPISDRAFEQHGFIVMQLTRIFGELNYNYGHIFNTNVGDVDFYDVVLNRRILYVLLPALEKSADTLKQLGKICVGMVNQVMAGCLGNRVEGIVREIIDSRPTNAPVPFYVFLDEYGRFAVLGFETAPAQARSLGFSITFSSQDFESLKKAGEESANAIWENTNIRVFGRATGGEDRSETWARLKGVAGEALQAVYGNFDRTYNTFGAAFRRGDTLNIERRSRVSYDDIASQQDGEFTFLLGKKHNEGKSGGVRVVRGMAFYTGGPDPAEIRLNDLLPVESPIEDIEQDQKELESLLLQALENDSLQTLLGEQAQPNAHIQTLGEIFARFDPVHKGISSRPEIAQAAIHLFLSETTEGELESAVATAKALSHGNHAEQRSAILTRVVNRDDESRQAAIERRRLAAQQSARHASDEETIGTVVQQEAERLEQEETAQLQNYHRDIRQVMSAHHFLFRPGDAQSVLHSDCTQADIVELDALTSIEAASNGPARSVHDIYEWQNNARMVRNTVVISGYHEGIPAPKEITKEVFATTVESLASKCARHIASEAKNN